MSEPSIRPVERETAAIKQLKSLVAERAESEAKIEREATRRAEAVERDFHEARQTLKAAFDAETHRIERRAVDEPQRLRQQFERIQDEADKTLRIAKADAARKLQAALDASKKGQSEARWEAGTLTEAGLNDAKARHDQAQNRLAAVEQEIRQLRAEADEHLRRCRLGSVARMPGAPAADQAAEATVEAAEAAREDAGGAFDHLRSRPLPNLIRGARPLLLLLVPAAGLATAGHFMVGGTQGIAAGAVGGLLLGGALIGAVFAAAAGQARLAFGAFRSAADSAESAAKRTRTIEAAEYRRRDDELTRRRDRDHVKADDAYRRAIDAARKIHEAAVSRADAAHKSILATATAARDKGLHAVEDETTRELPALKQEYESDVATVHERRERGRAEAGQWHARSLADMAERWRSGLGQVNSQFDALKAETDHAFPSFTGRDWSRTEPPSAVPAALPIGRLRVDLDMFPGGPPRDPKLMDGLPTSFDPPALLNCPEGTSLVLKSAAEGREAAIRALQAAMLRLLTGFPPGKVRFTILDPIGLGENFAAFMHLADFDEQLINSRIWTESQHIEQRLGDLTEHMENVIQKYLRNEYKTIGEYNDKAGEVAEPYRYLVVADFPARFTETTARRLLSVAASGARCGVFTLVHVDTRLELPQGFDLRDLEKHAAVLAWREGRLRWSEPVLGGFPLELDAPPPADDFTAIVQAVGERAKDAGRVEVPFAFIAPPDDKLWTKDSRAGIDVPLGRAGATKTQNLQLGRGTSQHVLIAGKTGSGKSTLLHILITNTALYYSPDEVELYLVDFKKGVEFKTYATHGLPHARVIAVESEREFGLSVLQRLDAELKLRGDLFRAVGAQDVAAYRAARPDEAMPRLLLIVDEFQEFFVEDDKIGQEAALLLDRLVRQGRAFGIHVHLGSQTLAGAYTLARATIGQMAVRIALQCGESDASLILSDENTAARLLSRPGEAIYNDANGRLEGNDFFQVVWLRDDEREAYLKRMSELARERGIRPRSQVIFEGNVPADPRTLAPLAALLDAPTWPLTPKVDTVWLGEPVAIKEPTSIVFRRQGGSHVLIVGQDEELAAGLMASSLITLAVQRPDVRLAVLDGTPVDASTAGLLDRVAKRLPQRPEVVGPAGAAALLEDVAVEVERRQREADTEAPPVFLFIHDLQRFRDLRKGEDDYGFSSRSSDEPAPPSERLATILREGPLHGVHAILWCDSLNNLNRTFDRNSLRELETRILFQMSAGDSSTLIDSPVANRLGARRALLVNEVQGLMEKFRPFEVPTADWLERVGSALASRAVNEAVAG